MKKSKVDKITSQKTAILAISVIIALIIAISSLTLVLFDPTIFPFRSPLPSPSSTPTPTLLPTPRISTDYNWGGYAVATNFSSPQPVITAVGASWTVPQISISSSDTFSAIWVGIGGTFSTSLIQVGTEQDCINGQIVYSAWYELLPQNSRTIADMIISPGDNITASVAMENGSLDAWTINIRDLSNGQNFHQTFFYYSSQLSAEWIVERPTVNGQLSSLADFGQIIMSNCTATVNGITGNLGDFNFIQTLLENNQGSSLLDSSDISADHSSFSVNYSVLPD